MVRSHRAFLRAVVVATVFLLPLAVVPGLERPFSSPKLALWIVVSAAGLVSCRRRLGSAWNSLPRALQLSLTLWVVAVAASAALSQVASLDSLLLLFVGPAWLVLLLAARPQAERLAWGLVLSGGVVAAIALAQFLRVDPFALLGWIPAADGNARMSIFATLGNPNFVAAFLAGVLPLTFSLATSIREQRRLLIALLALQVAALLATGSRAPILGVIAAAFWMAVLKQRRSWLALGLVAFAMVAVTAAFSPARDLRSTLSGRSYIWKVSAPHLAEHPVLGLGPGGFGTDFAAWETQYWRKTADESNRKFVGIEDHAHNDYLEIFTDYGVLGLAAFVALLAVFLRGAWVRARTQDNPLAAGASAGVVALASVSMVDFPLMRPTESFLLWSLMAICLLSTDGVSRARRESALVLKGE